MYFLIPLIIGFIFNWASAFTGFYTSKWGERRGRAATFIMRNILGIPVWVIGLILAVRQPSPLLFEPSPAIRWLAWLLAGLGVVPMVLALIRLRKRSYNPSSADTLVDTGIYGRIRHPIYTGVLLELASAAIGHPTSTTLIACGLCLIYVFVQARFEELDLLRRIPSYRDYMTRVPRFFPRLLRRA